MPETNVGSSISAPALPSLSINWRIRIFLGMRPASGTPRQGGLIDPFHPAHHVLDGELVGDGPPTRYQPGAEYRVVMEPQGRRPQRIAVTRRDEQAVLL